MAKITAFTGTMRGGEFFPDDKASFARAFARKDGERVVFTIKRLVPKRSTDQNAYWWSCVVPLFQEEMGEDSKEETHRDLLIELGHCTEHTSFGKRKLIPKPTKDLPADEFSNLIDRAERLFQRQFGGRLPPVGSAQAEAMVNGS